jgi:hypothetical protein
VQKEIELDLDIKEDISVDLSIEKLSVEDLDIEVAQTQPESIYYFKDIARKVSIEFEEPDEKSGESPVDIL